ncbi:MAG: hypothetical protein ABW321_13615 [Polyangiales bacterium]
MCRLFGSGLVLAWITLVGGCTGPSCVRNSQCELGLECRASTCQVPLPPASPSQPVGGSRGCRRGFYCGYGGTGTSPPVAGHPPVNTSTRYQDGGARDASPNEIAAGTGATAMDAGADAASGSP